ncbi:hypothetical protein HK099_000288 [Clydaea vesicula]|uniref:Uncharacterized protein n=1 Tax=Clydaea vesicula TaxID=447962 RepID=A0AAD5Y1Q1_9FUNG|nr:hypothetical protein HK099_000288 [Clydaea vesicula]
MIPTSIDLSTGSARNFLRRVPLSLTVNGIGDVNNFIIPNKIIREENGNDDTTDTGSYTTKLGESMIAITDIISSNSNDIEHDIVFNEVVQRYLSRSYNHFKTSLTSRIADGAQDQAHTAVLEAVQSMANGINTLHQQVCKGSITRRRSLLKRNTCTAKVVKPIEQVFKDNGIDIGSQGEITEKMVNDLFRSESLNLEEAFEVNDDKKLSNTLKKIFRINFFKVLEKRNADNPPSDDIQYTYYKADPDINPDIDLLDVLDVSKEIGLEVANDGSIIEKADINIKGIIDGKIAELEKIIEYAENIKYTDYKKYQKKLAKLQKVLESKGAHPELVKLYNTFVNIISLQFIIDFAVDKFETFLYGNPINTDKLSPPTKPLGIDPTAPNEKLVDMDNKLIEDGKGTVGDNNIQNESPLQDKLGKWHRAWKPIIKNLQIKAKDNNVADEKLTDFMNIINPIGDNKNTESFRDVFGLDKVSDLNIDEVTLEKLQAFKEKIRFDKDDIESYMLNVDIYNNIAYRLHMNGKSINSKLLRFPIINDPISVQEIKILETELGINLLASPEEIGQYAIDKIIAKKDVDRKLLKKYIGLKTLEINRTPKEERNLVEISKIELLSVSADMYIIDIRPLDHVISILTQDSLVLLNKAGLKNVLPNLGKDSDRTDTNNIIDGQELLAGEPNHDVAIHKLGELMVDYVEKNPDNKISGRLLSNQFKIHRLLTTELSTQLDETGEIDKDTEFTHNTLGSRIDRMLKANIKLQDSGEKDDPTFPSSSTSAVSKSIGINPRFNIAKKVDKKLSNKLGRLGKYGKIGVAIGRFIKSGSISTKSNKEPKSKSTAGHLSSKAILTIKKKMNLLNIKNPIITMDTDIKIDPDLRYPKPIHTMFGDELAKKFNNIVYNDNSYVFFHHSSDDSYALISVIDQGNSMEDFILYECNAQRKSAYSSTYYMGTSGTLILFYDSLEDFLTMMEPPRVFEYWNGRGVIVAQNTIFKYNPF